MLKNKRYKIIAGISAAKTVEKHKISYANRLVKHETNHNSQA